MFEVRKRIQATISKAFKREKGRQVCADNYVFSDIKFLLQKREKIGSKLMIQVMDWMTCSFLCLTFVGLNTY